MKTRTLSSYGVSKKTKAKKLEVGPKWEDDGALNKVKSIGSDASLGNYKEVTETTIPEKPRPKSPSQETMSS